MGIFTAKIANQFNLHNIKKIIFVVVIYTKCFYNIKQYLHLLPVHEQMAEIKKMIDFYSKLNLACYNVKKRFRQIEQLKNFKKNVKTLKNVQ